MKWQTKRIFSTLYATNWTSQIVSIDNQENWLDKYQRNPSNKKTCYTEKRQQLFDISICHSVKFYFTQFEKKNYDYKQKQNKTKNENIEIREFLWYTVYLLIWNEK